jgi:hypothetical protein
MGGLVFSDDLLDAALEEAIERRDLLGDETVLLEVLVNYCPGVFRLDLSTENLIFRVLHLY